MWSVLSLYSHLGKKNILDRPIPIKTIEWNKKNDLINNFTIEVKMCILLGWVLRKDELLRDSSSFIFHSAIKVLWDANTASSCFHIKLLQNCTPTCPSHFSIIPALPLAPAGSTVHPISRPIIHNVRLVALMISDSL